MRLKLTTLSIMAASSLLLTACGGENGTTLPTTPTVPTPTTPTPTPTEPTTPTAPQANLGIETVIPSSLGSSFVTNFKRYTKVVAPNGKAIHILAQDKITTNQIIRARGILQHYLKNYPGSVHGADKSAITNKMADNGAKLLLLNGSDDGTNPAAQLNGQPLYQNEMQVEGHSWYTQQNYEHRDAAFEEILHMVHDTGIGVDGNGSFDGAAQNFQTEIRAAQQNGLANNLWGAGAENASWITELTAENSLSQEYLASVIDAYYGLWGAWKDSSEAKSATHSMWGIYVAKGRSDIPSKDATGQTLLDNKFFHPYLTYNARIDESFTGTFSLKYDAALSYTHHAQYLKDITLTGSKAVNVKINQLDNNITGNTGSNTVIFTGPAQDYSVTVDNGVTTVVDNRPNRDGTNKLSLVEELQFSDSTTTL